MCTNETFLKIRRQADVTDFVGRSDGLRQLEQSEVIIISIWIVGHRKVLVITRVNKNIVDFAYNFAISRNLKQAL
jgi:fructosamine-3-kinase